MIAWVSRHMAGRPIGPVVSLLVLVSLVPVATEAADSPSGSYIGRTLVDVVRELQSQGTKIIYTTRLLRNDLKVLNEPTAATPADLLDEILRPHGMQTVRGPNKSLVIVRHEADETAQPGKLVGTVRAPDGRKLSVTARIAFVGTGLETTTDEKGRFEVEMTPGTYVVHASAPGYISQELAPVVVREHRVTELPFRLTRFDTLLESIVVNPEASSRRRDDSEIPEVVTQEEIATVSRLFDDPFENVSRLPGAADSELSARPHIRGGRADEVLVVFDGVELHDPFHLQDLQGGLFSIVDSAAVGSVDFFAGAFPVRYGNRMSGVIDISTTTPENDHDGSLTLATNYARLATRGTIASDHGNWLVTARLGNPTNSLPPTVAEERYDPRYYDVMGKIEYRIAEKTTISANFLIADDRTKESRVPSSLAPDADDPTFVAAEYGNQYGWLTFKTAWNSKLFSRTVVSAGQVDRHRNVFESDISTVRDVRDFTFVGLRQDWNHALSDRHQLGWGFEARQVKADYDYSAIPTEDNSILDPEGVRIDLRPSGQEYALYLSDTFRASRHLIAEFGLRWDRETYSTQDEQFLSPRINLMVTPTDRDSLRLSWGEFHQSQRVYELQVEDGVETFSAGEVSEQAELAFNHRFSNSWSLGARVYWTEVGDPRPRFENSLDPASLYPEGQLDRILIAPERVESRGIELTWGGRVGDDLTWRVGYARSIADDVIDGENVPRSWDQTDAFDFWVNYTVSRVWNFNLAGSFHTGWPTTERYPIRLADEDGELLIGTGLGPRNRDRLPNYRRLDLRVSREFQPGIGTLRLFVDVTNLLDARNACCAEDFDFKPSEESGFLEPSYKYGIDRTTTFGVTWAF